VIHSTWRISIQNAHLKPHNSFLAFQEAHTEPLNSSFTHKNSTIFQSSFTQGVCCESQLHHDHIPCHAINKNNNQNASAQATYTGIIASHIN
jgi:hypothetical protein